MADVVETVVTESNIETLRVTVVPYQDSSKEYIDWVKVQTIANDRLGKMDEIIVGSTHSTSTIKTMSDF